MSVLMTPVDLGAIKIKNRFVMAPLTRCRCTGADQRTPNQLMAEYYKQRASAGLIITEATSISPEAVGYPNTPGIWSDVQIKAWKNIVEAVHGAGGKIVMQLWHVGRVSDPIYLNGALPVAPSALAADGHVRLVRPEKNYETPRALTTDEIFKTIDNYKKAAQNALAAGFDGVEIHGANQYLIEQFMHEGSNLRTDQFGGTLENRMRFLMNVVDAVISVWGADRVGLHLSPNSDLALRNPESRVPKFLYIAQQMKARKIAFLCIREPEGEDSLISRMKFEFNGPCIANDSFNFSTAENIVSRGTVEAVAFGKLFIANPDLVERFLNGAELNIPDFKTFYTQNAAGYIDYPLAKSN